MSIKMANRLHERTIDDSNVQNVENVSQVLALL